MKNQQKGFFLTPGKLLLLVFLVALVSVLLLAVGVFRTFKKPESTREEGQPAKHTVEIWSPDGKETKAMVDREIMLKAPQEVGETAEVQTGGAVRLPESNTALVVRAEVKRKKEPQTTAADEREVLKSESPKTVERSKSDTELSVVQGESEATAERERGAEQRRAERVAQAKAELAERKAARAKQREEAAAQEVQKPAPKPQAQPVAPQPKPQPQQQPKQPKEVIDNLF
ncbi:MAG: hypothetical protein Q4D82_03005 [Neisseria sp.]|nr:hypothetical protein [Neisseria sp.]